MMRQCFATISVLAFATTGAGLATSLHAQDYATSTKADAPAKAAAPAKTAAATAAPARGAAPIRRTPDGVPDISGTWVKNGGGLNEANRPKSALSSQCAEAFGKAAEPIGFSNVIRTYPQLKNVYAPPQGRPTGIVDPPDRVLPLTPEAAKLREEYGVKTCCPAVSWTYIELSARCAAPTPMPGGTVEILQYPGHVVMLFEGNHGSRVIYTDGRPRVSSNVRSFGGESLGRWEGNTLVVETRNLNGLIHLGIGTPFPPFSQDLKLTERFTVLSPQLIDYESIYDDPKTFTRPVKSAGFLFPANDDYFMAETVCTEGAYTLKSMYGF